MQGIHALGAHASITRSRRHTVTVNTSRLATTETQARSAPVGTEYGTCSTSTRARQNATAIRFHACIGRLCQRPLHFFLLPLLLRRFQFSSILIYPLFFFTLGVFIEKPHTCLHKKTTTRTTNAPPLHGSAVWDPSRVH